MVKMTLSIYRKKYCSQIHIFLKKGFRAGDFSLWILFLSKNSKNPQKRDSKWRKNLYRPSGEKKPTLDRAGPRKASP